LNIAEGYAYGSVPKFKAHLRIAYASAVEATDILEVLQELGAAVEPALLLSRQTQAITLRFLQRLRP
jgi:four helix bundle protein